MPKKIERWTPPRFVSVPRHREQAHYQTADWRAKRERILVRDAFVCRACGRVVSGHEANVDHIVPLEDGGSDRDDNLQTLCRSCHGTKTHAEQRRRGAP
jgi:5-methylcytosine-specific restriction endonuclease McrA